MAQSTSGGETSFYRVLFLCQLLGCPYPGLALIDITCPYVGTLRGKAGYIVYCLGPFAPPTESVIPSPPLPRMAHQSC